MIELLRLTARKFLAAANFLELLAIFGEVAAEASYSFALSRSLRSSQELMRSLQ